ncbi:MAG: glycosyltransferase [Bryobacteraceae bacterium]
MQPLVSIVIPTHGRPEKLWNCLQAIGEVEYPSDRFEVIVVDDGSSVAVENSVKSFGESFPLRVLRQDNRGPAVARNTGMRSAAGSLIAFTDDDCQPDRNWLRQLAESHQRNPDAALGGQVRNALSDRICSEASQLLVDYLYEYYGSLSNGSGFFTSNNLAFPAKTLTDLGGFDETFPLAAGEDREICDRWTRGGRQLLYVPEAIVYHRHDLTIPRFAAAV